MTDKEISIQITRYINGELNDQEEDLLWEKFLEDEKYYRIFETELHLADLYRNQGFRLDESEEPNRINSPKRNYKVFITSAAALILLSVMVSTFFFQNSDQPASLAISDIELTQMIGSEVFRAEIPDSDRIDQQINRAISIALSGNTDEATEIFMGLSQEELSDVQNVRINYNLGILAYNEGDYKTSLDMFLTTNRQIPADAPDFILESTKWYISNIYLHQNNVEDATSLLREIANSESNYSVPAENLLSVLSSSD